VTKSLNETGYHGSLKAHERPPILSSSQRVAILFEGPPQVGKGTQANALSTYFGIPIFETGEVLRGAAAADPDNPLYEPMKRRELVSDKTVLHLCKGWTIRHRSYHELVYDGIPRNRKQQEELLMYLLDREFLLRVCWFSTDPYHCITRPARPNRKEDMSKELQLKGIEEFEKHTLPTFDQYRLFGVSEAQGNMLVVDNAALTPRQTAGKIISFLGLPCTPENLFPSTEKNSPVQEQPHAAVA